MKRLNHLYVFGVLTSLILAGASGVYAQTSNVVDGLLKRCGGYFGLCGYISETAWKDERREVEVLPKVYEALGEYSEGLAPVRVKGRWGFMDRNGVMKIMPAYTSVSAFDYGLAVVGTQTGYGLIDKTGEFLILPDFKWMVIYNQNRVLASQSGEIKYDPFERLSRYKGRYINPYDDTDTPISGLYEIGSGWLTSQTLKFQNFDADAYLGQGRR